MRGVLFAAGLLLFGASGAQAQENPPAAPVDTVALRFAWPTDLEAQVEVTRLRVRTREDGEDSTAIAMHYRMRTEAAGEDLLLRFDEFQVQGADRAAAAELQGALHLLAQTAPDYRVNRAGEFGGIENVAALQARLESMLAPLLDSLQAAPADLRSLLQSFTSAPVLNAMAAEEWNLLVGTWVDADLELDALYEFEQEAPVPILPGATLPMVTQFGVAARVPCEEGEVVARCVELRMISRPDPDAVQALLQRLLQGTLDAVAGGARYDAFEVENEVTLITEPGTLRPYRLLTSKFVEVTVRMGEQRQEARQEDHRAYHFRYHRP